MSALVEERAIFEQDDRKNFTRCLQPTHVTSPPSTVYKNLERRVRDIKRLDILFFSLEEKAIFEKEGDPETFVSVAH